MLPDFLVIGAFKAGTTSLHHYLDKHPRIFMTRLKEPNFFAHTKSDPNHDNRNIFPVTDLAQYERLFADARADQLKGEASPGYLPSKQAPRKIKEQIPDIRLLATLRDPVDRAYSHYLMELRNEQISLPPNEAFDAGGYWLEASNYARQLNRYLEHFRPDQIKVVLYEEMRSDADKVVHDILDWLGLPPLDTLNANESAMWHLLQLDKEASEQSIRNFLGGFNFLGDEVDKAIAPFSGGEKFPFPSVILLRS